MSDIWQEGLLLAFEVFVLATTNVALMSNCHVSEERYENQNFEEVVSL